jgi:hypothetical protein
MLSLVTAAALSASSSSPPPSALSPPLPCPQASPDPAAGDPLGEATYRFFANDYIRAEAVLASHLHATYTRLRSVPLVLAVQDTTYLNWTDHPATQGLGPLAAPSQRGLLAHSTLAFTPERVPLGLLQQQVWARDPEVRHNQDHKQRPLEEKESHKWLESLAAVAAAREACPTTHFVSVGDREADVYDLFLEERPRGVDVLVRASWDRCVEHEEKYLWAAMATAPLAATVTLRLGRREGRAARSARLSVRWREVTLHPPKSRSKEKLGSVRVWAVWAVEERPPAGMKAVEWLLLTTVPVTSSEEALERLEWYACRWGIEVWHKVLKSGCRIEERQLESAERLTRCLTLYSVIAWRLLYATLLARAAPEVACTVLLEEEEWQALYCAIHEVAVAPAKVPSLRQAVRWLAQLGGFLGRKGDGEPGVEVLWKGFQRLVDLTHMYHIMHVSPRLERSVPANRRSG